MKQLPASVKPYKKTAVFTENTIPAGLLKDHTTAEGVWGLIHILSGELGYQISGEKEGGYILNQKLPGIVEPKVKHHIKAIAAVKFYIEFNR